MAVYSALTARRSIRRLQTATQQLIVFRLFSESFALPIRAVQKVTQLGNLYGAAGHAGVSLTLYQDQELLVIDVEARIFRGTPRLQAATSITEANSLPQIASEPRPSYLLVVQNTQGKLVGLPIAEPPTLQRIPESAFAPLTSAYISEGNIRCVSALVVPNKEEPPIFLLNPEQLVQPAAALPPGFS